MSKRMTGASWDTNGERGSSESAGPTRRSSWLNESAAWIAPGFPNDKWCVTHLFLLFEIRVADYLEITAHIGQVRVMFNAWRRWSTSRCVAPLIADKGFKRLKFFIQTTDGTIASACLAPICHDTFCSPFYRSIKTCTPIFAHGLWNTVSPNHTAFRLKLFKKGAS